MPSTPPRPQMEALCQDLGTGILLTQGAGGNASWKEEGALWIKASGKWLSDAARENIFVRLDLARARQLIAAGSSDFASAAASGTGLRPSIETSLHALMPFRIVLHLHPVEVIAWAVRRQARDLLDQRLSGLAWAWIDYFKPGRELAEAVAAEIASRATPPAILVLGKHGLVLGADDVEGIQTLLAEVLARLRQPPRAPAAFEATRLAQWQSRFPGLPYQPAAHPRAHAIALDGEALALARGEWVLMPDHAVFLGAQALVLAPEADALEVLKRWDSPPACLVVAGVGVLCRTGLDRNAQALLDCFAEVALRLPSAQAAEPLAAAEIAELLGWEAETYRRSLSR